MTLSPSLPMAGPWTVLGLMSGTSADGADEAMIQVDPGGFARRNPFLAFLGHHHEPYPDALREAVLAAAGDRLKPSELCVLQTRLGAHHARTARQLADNLGLAPQLASLHGQTVQHWPDQNATLQ